MKKETEIGAMLLQAKGHKDCPQTTISWERILPQTLKGSQPS